MLLIIDSLIRDLLGLIAAVLMFFIANHLFQLERAQKKYRLGSNDLRQEAEKRWVWVGLNGVGIVILIIAMFSF